jgi:DNA-binding NtrC family response regulator
MSAKKPAILIVDDEPDVLFSLTGLLRREFQVYTANSGPAALEIMSEHPVNVIMTDQRMPSMTGTELMSRVKSEHPRAVRIVFTGYADTRAVIDAINRGELYRYITKPWDPEDLIEVLREAAKKHDELVAQESLVRELPELLDTAERMMGELTPPDAEQAHGLRAQIEHFRHLLERLGT